MLFSSGVTQQFYLNESASAEKLLQPLFFILFILHVLFCNVDRTLEDNLLRIKGLENKQTNNNDQTKRGCEQLCKYVLRHLYKSCVSLYENHFSSVLTKKSPVIFNCYVCYTAMLHHQHIICNYCPPLSITGGRDNFLTVTEEGQQPEWL